MRVFLVLMALFAAAFAARDPNECEVCIKVLTDLREKLGEKDSKDQAKIEDTLGKYCEKQKGETREGRLCYYLDPIKREVSAPMKNGVPSDVICQRLKKKSAEICAIKYTAAAPPPKAADLSASSDFAKMKIGQLKQIAAEVGVCGAASCPEKGDYVRALKAHFAAAKKEL